MIKTEKQIKEKLKKVQKAYDGERRPVYKQYLQGKLDALEELFLTESEVEIVRLKKENEELKKKIEVSSGSTDHCPNCNEEVGLIFERSFPFCDDSCQTEYQGKKKFDLVIERNRKGVTIFRDSIVIDRTFRPFFKPFLYRLGVEIPDKPNEVLTYHTIGIFEREQLLKILTESRVIVGDRCWLEGENGIMKTDVFVFNGFTNLDNETKFQFGYCKPHSKTDELVRVSIWSMRRMKAILDTAITTMKGEKEQ